MCVRGGGGAAVGLPAWELSYQDPPINKRTDFCCKSIQLKTDDPTARRQAVVDLSEITEISDSAIISYNKTEILFE